MFYLPSYSPELNRDERLNTNLKHEISSKAPVRTKAKLKEAARKYMMKVEQNLERVRSYSCGPRDAYVEGYIYKCRINRQEYDLK